MKKNLLITAIFVLIIKISFSLQLTGFFPFSNNLNDLSQNNYSANLVGNCALQENSILLPDDNFSYLNMSPSLLYGLNDLTINFKIKFNNLHSTGTNPTNHIISSSNTNLYEIFYCSYQQNLNKFYVKFNGVTVGFTPNISITTSTWYDITIVKSSGFCKFYLNSILLGSTFTSNNPLFPAKFIIGQEEDCHGGCFAQNQSTAGNLKELVVYDDDLTTEQIINNFNCNLISQASLLNGNLPIGSTAQINVVINNILPTNYLWQTDFGLGFQNLIDLNQYLGSNSNSLNVSNLNFNNHNQNFRVIVSNSLCTDTSLNVVIQLNQTCIKTIYDTTNVTIIDTIFQTVIDSSIVTTYDTIYFNSQDTIFLTVYDTIFQTVYDTIFQTVYDTIFQTVYDTVTIYITDSLITKSNQLTFSENVKYKIFPNPSIGSFTFEISDFALNESYRLIITDNLGRVIYSELLNNAITYVSNKNYSRGIYFIGLINNENKISAIEKLIITD